MNLNFTDVGMSIINIVQQDVSKEVMLNASNIDEKRPVFSEKLDKTLEPVEPVKEEIPVKPQKEKTSDVQNEITQKISKKVSEKISEKISEKVPEKLSEKLDQPGGYEFILGLKNYFLALSKGRLSDITIDPQGLEALKKMLLKAGFKESEIEDLMTDLSDNLNRGTLTLDEVFNALSQLHVETDDLVDEEAILEAWQVPFIESILVSLGMPQQEVQTILSEADRGNKGISLDVVIEKLQKEQKKAFYSGQSFQVPETDTNIQMLFRQSGLDLGNKGSGVFSLNDVVRSLEAMRQNTKDQRFFTINDSRHGQKDLGDEKSADLLNVLFKSLKIKQNSPENKAIEFSTDKIKEKFENPALLTPKDGAETKNLFGEDKTKNKLKNAGQKEVFKEMETLVDQKTKESSNAKDTLIDAKIGARRLTAAGDKKIDQNQTAAEPKPGEFDRQAGILKSRAPAKPLPAYVTQQVSKSLARAINQGESSLKIQLKPPELGRMLLTIQKSGNSLRVSIMTENHSAKEIIAQNLTEIRTTLSNSGVNLERFEVDMSSDFRQSMADARQQAGNSGKRNRNQADKRSVAGVSDGFSQGISEINGMDKDGSVHLVA